MDTISIIAFIVCGTRARAHIVLEQGLLTSDTLCVTPQYDASKGISKSKCLSCDRAEIHESEDVWRFASRTLGWARGAKLRTDQLGYSRSRERARASERGNGWRGF